MPAIDRAQWLADARALLDYIEANPELPLNMYRSIELSYHPLPNSGDDDRKKAAVDVVAKQLGVTVTTPDTCSSSHYQAEISFGSASYRAVAVLKSYMDVYHAVQRLGEAALAEQRAAA